ncbi:hypothetical protein SAY87_012604 [Trapa incisa]|uniref:Phytocyanin domain-containing protein n=1 Tax=Trapa incisa TaxID=236973 RepID=A0AAN7H1B5_9MYRT|nr:hypothetical protein SAY87_012604 [Trapa incisa]
MAGFRIVWTIVAVLCLGRRSMATVYTVGDDSGWAMGTDYSAWASGKTFLVGDSLVFNYGSLHSVDEVSSSDYTSCSAANSITSDSSGSTTIPLKTAGAHYYICGAGGHCIGGMKLAITVKASSPAPSGSTTPADSGSPPTTTTTSPPATATTTSSTGSSSGAIISPLVASLVGMIGLIYLS